MEAGGQIEPVARQRQHKITGSPTFSEVRVGDGRNDTIELRNRGAGLLDIETINPTCIE
jgi:hypothetical protein